ncbi:MAG: type I restriction enzyme HsdR N-terminal domain-containing protein [Bacteroidia bacterium]
MNEKLWDPIRQAGVAATPEERVRQAFIHFLVQKGCPWSAIQVEYSVPRGGRFDVAVCAPDGSLWLLAECKAETSAKEKLWGTAWAQLRRYARYVGWPKYFAIVIGAQIWCWQARDSMLLEEFPAYPK